MAFIKMMLDSAAIDFNKITFAKWKGPLKLAVRLQGYH